MDAIDVIARCRVLGAVLTVERDTLKIRAPKPLPDDLREAVRDNKPQVILCLRSSQRSACSNPNTPHDTHDLPWECDPNSCYCWRVYGEPRICQGVPCRWTFPKSKSSA